MMVSISHFTSHVCLFSSRPPSAAVESEAAEVSPDIVAEDVKVVAVVEKGGLHQSRADAAPEEPLLVGAVLVLVAPLNKNLI